MRRFPFPFLTFVPPSRVFWIGIGLLFMSIVGDQGRGEAETLPGDRSPDGGPAAGVSSPGGSLLEALHLDSAPPPRPGSGLPFPRFVKSTPSQFRASEEGEFLPIPVLIPLSQENAQEATQEKMWAALQRGQILNAQLQARALAEKGDVAAQFLLGSLLERGVGFTRPDRKKALHWYTKAAQQGQSGAAVSQALLLLENTKQGETAEGHHLQIEALLQKSVEGGRSEAAYLLACMLLRLSDFSTSPEETEQRAQRGWSLWDQAARANVVPAQYDLARFHLGQEELVAPSLKSFLTPRQDPHQGAYWMGRAAENGHVAAQAAYGILRLKGEGILPDPEEGALWLQRAAAAGNPVAMSRLARLYTTEKSGLGFQPEKAKIWALRARKAGFHDPYLAEFLLLHFPLSEEHSSSFQSP